MQREATPLNCDITHDKEDNVWFMRITNDSCWLHGSRNWLFDSTGHVKGDKIYAINISYCPPFSGRVRFDASISNDKFSDLEGDEAVEAIAIYEELLVKFGHAGKNTIRYFENLEAPAKPKPADGIVEQQEFFGLRRLLSKFRKLFQ